MKNVLDKLAPNAHWLLRLALGAVFIYHGAQKFSNLAGTADMLHMPFIVATLVACAEFFGGVFVIGGAFTKDIVTRLGGLFISIVMLGAFFLVHINNGFEVGKGGFEFVMTLFAIAMYFVLKGNSVGKSH